MLRGRLPGAPRIGLEIVDVRDLADVHVRAMTDPAAGQRFLATGEFTWMREMARALRAGLGEAGARVSTRAAARRRRLPFAAAEQQIISAAELGERLGLSTGAVSMLLTELIQWGIVKKAWVVGERREHYEAETSIWKMVSRVFRERELNWIKTALEAFEAAGTGARRRSSDARRKLIAERIASLTQLAQVGAHLLEAMLEGESVDALPLKTIGELAKKT